MALEPSVSIAASKQYFNPRDFPGLAMISALAPLLFSRAADRDKQDAGIEQEHSLSI
jgi:hypothetical protein